MKTHFRARGGEEHGVGAPGRGTASDAVGVDVKRTTPVRNPFVCIIRFPAKGRRGAARRA